jgi:hypothetical protein
MRKIVIAAYLAGLGCQASAQLSDRALDQLEGYTLIAKKKVAGYITEKGRFEDSFEGCDFDRVIVFTDETAVVCDEFGYQYAYMPEAYVFAKGRTLRLVVRDKVYRIRPYE